MNDGGPAFPRPASENTEGGTLPEGNVPVREQGGMSLRDYFAGQVLAGMAANPFIGQNIGQLKLNATETALFVSTKAYEVADAMLAEREKNKS